MRRTSLTHLVEATFVWACRGVFAGALIAFLGSSSCIYYYHDDDCHHHDGDDGHCHDDDHHHHLGPDAGETDPPRGADITPVRLARWTRGRSQDAPALEIQTPLVPLALLDLSAYRLGEHTVTTTENGTREYTGLVGISVQHSSCAGEYSPGDFRALSDLIRLANPELGSGVELLAGDARITAGGVSVEYRPSTALDAATRDLRFVYDGHGDLVWIRDRTTAAR